MIHHNKNAKSVMVAWQSGMPYSTIDVALKNKNKVVEMVRLSFVESNKTGRDST